MRRLRTLLGLQGVARNDLQLISVACMLVAAKHEEVSQCEMQIPQAGGNLRTRSVLLCCRAPNGVYIGL